MGGLLDPSAAPLGGFSASDLRSELFVRTVRARLKSVKSPALNGAASLSHVTDQQLTAALVALRAAGDDRREVTHINDPAVQENARSVAAVVHRSELVADGSFFVFRSPALRERLPICPQERFIDQPSAAVATAFLIAPDVVLTVNHGFEQVQSVHEFQFVFGFDINDVAAGRCDAADVYRGVDVLLRGSTPSGADWRLVRLDRATPADRPPLRVTTSPATQGMTVYMLGHPLGLPMKHAGNARIVDDTAADVFLATVDAFRANSGSPVFNDRNEVEGMLIRGPGDLEPVGDCYVSHFCAENGCRGETVLRVGAVPLPA